MMKLGLGHDTIWRWLSFVPRVLGAFYDWRIWTSVDFSKFAPDT